MTKKGQAAMEFLMTYGWAILVVLAAIAALAYFGVLSPDRFLPEQCILESGLACLDFSVTTDSVTLVLSNALGRDIEINQIAAGACNQTFNQTMKNGDQQNFVLTGCSNGISGVKFRADVRIDYVNTASGLEKASQGSLTSKIQ